MANFKKGQEVVALMGENHLIDTDDVVEHKAQFLSYHPGGAWADIELEKEHAGGTKRLSVPVSILKAVLILFAVLLADPTRAQDIGEVGLRNVSATLASSLACTGAAQVFSTTSATLNAAGFRNLGQLQHAITIQGNGSITSLQAEIDGIDNAGNVFRISDVLFLPAFFGNASLSGSGNFPNIQVQVTCSPVAGTFTLTYSGTLAPNPAPVGSYQIGQLDKQLSFNASAGSNLTSNFQTPFGNSAGLLYFVGNGAGVPVGTTISVGCKNASGTSNPADQFIPTPGQSVLFVFPVPAGACPFVQVSYVAGGASAATYQMEYQFFQSGVLNGTYQYTPTQLGVNALTEPGAGTSALSNVIDTRGVKEARLSYSCTAGAITVNVQTYNNDSGNPLTTALVSPVSGVAAATAADLYIGSESNPAVDTGTLATPPAGVVRFPQPFLAFSFTNAGVAGTCTARLFLTY